MSTKNERLDMIRLIVSSQEIGNQDDMLKALASEGFVVTQATLSRDLKQMKVAKAINTMGKAVYVLPNNTMYQRVKEHRHVREMMQTSGFISIRFSGNIGVIKTRPGYASGIAYDIDNANIPVIIGTIAGDDTILIVVEEGSPRNTVLQSLSGIIPV